MTFIPTDPQSADQRDTGRIRGRVVAAETGAPLRGARVIVWGGDAARPHDCDTDADGRYEVGQLPPGSFFVSAAKSEYLSVAYGQARLRLMEPGAAVMVEAGQTVEHIDLALPRGGVIVVRLTDDDGQPFAGALIQIQRFQYATDGEQRLNNVPTGIRGPAITDDRGELRAFGLAPGKYVIRATVRSIRLASAGIATRGFAPTYYPGKTSAGDAQVVSLGLSEEKAVQFTMIASPLSRVAGIVVTSAGQPAAGMDLQLAPPDGESGTVYGTGSVAEDGTFSIAGVPRGNYTLQVRQGARPRHEDIIRVRETGVAPRRVRGEFASVPVTIGDENVTDLRIVTSPGATIRGRVVFDGASAPPSTNELRVVAVPPGLAGGGWAVVGSSVYDFPPDAGLAADGRFEITGASGRVQLDLRAEGWMLESITLNDREITDEALDLAARDSVSDVVITMTDMVTSVAGYVRDQDGQLVRNYVVVLLPRDPIAPTSVSRWIRTSRPSADGRFEIRHVRPGAYVAAAVEWIELGRQFAPEFQQLLRRGAHELTVGKGQTMTIDLPLTPSLALWRL